MSQDDLRQLLHEAVQFALENSPHLPSEGVLRDLYSGVFVTEYTAHNKAPIAQPGNHVMQMITAHEANPERSRSWKLENIWISWDKLLDLALDAGVAGYGASSGMVLGVTLAALYILNKIRKAACEMLSRDDAIAMMALWSARNGANQVWIASGLKVTNLLRSKYSLSPLAAGEFSTLLDRLSDLKCLYVSHGVIALTEVVKVRK